MCSVAVDFAKHGECVAKQNFEDIKRDLDDDFPDFMERDPSKSYVSNGILGILYRDIQNENALYQFIKNDWENSICLQYSLDDKILGLVSSSSRQMHQYLFEVYREIV